MGPLARKLDEQFTYGDYLTWDDDERWELIDGIPYGMAPAPRLRHQGILMELSRQFANYLVDKPCRLFAAPFDVRLPAADEIDELIQTVVQPDLSVICDRHKLDEAGCRGAPDLVVEILSPGTAHKDLNIKFERYERAGVREYWIVDPTEKKVMTFVRGANGRYGRPEIYAAEVMAPVTIFPDLQIALSTVFEH